MNNDLDEFLRRTAAMRQQKAFEQRAEAQRLRDEQSRSRPKPYTNARREREVDLDDDDDDEETLVGVEVLGLEIIEEKPPRGGQRERPAQRKPHVKSDPPSASVKTSHATLPAQLRAMLAQPDGARNAFLLREIFNRPQF